MKSEEDVDQECDKQQQVGSQQERPRDDPRSDDMYSTKIQIQIQILEAVE
jgi:hypothetical protein